MTNREIIDALKRDGADRIRREARVGPVCRYGVIEEIVHGIDAAAKMLAPDVLTVKDAEYSAGAQARPREKCPVCGEKFDFVTEGRFWSCYCDRKTHMIYGPDSDPDGRKIDAMVRKMRS